MYTYIVYNEKEISKREINNPLNTFIKKHLKYILFLILLIKTKGTWLGWWVSRWILLTAIWC